MISIRRRINFWMIPGIAIVWIIGGFSVYQTYRNAIFSAIDSENMAFTRLIRMSQRSQGRGKGAGMGQGNHQRPSSTDLSEKGVFYQAWDRNGTILAKSENLGKTELSFPENRKNQVSQRTLALSPEIRVRILETSFGSGRAKHQGRGFGGGGGGGGMSMVIVVARDLTETDQKLKNAVIGISGAGMLMVGGMVLLLRIALRDGLKPLDALGAEISDVNPSSLNARFSTGQEPLELKPIVSHLDRLMDRVEKGFLRERRFGADLAHELRTPIAEMRTKLDLAAKWPEERNDALFQAAREINTRMQRVVDTMLHLAQFEGDSESSEAVTQDILLAPIVAETWSPLKEYAAERKLETVINCPETATVQGDPELWKHILGNLFSNAVDYTPTGGIIQLEILENGLSLSNSVSDLSTKDAQQMFERFWRADGSRSDSHHSGLGLSLVKACAENMGFKADACFLEHDSARKLVISIKKAPRSTC